MWPGSIGRSTADRRTKSGTERIAGADSEAAEIFAGVQWPKDGITPNHRIAESQNQDVDRKPQGTGQETAPGGETEERNHARPA